MAKWNNTPRTERVQIRLTPQEIRRLRNEAGYDRIYQVQQFGVMVRQTTVSDILRQALEMYLNSPRMNVGGSQQPVKRRRAVPINSTRR